MSAHVVADIKYSPKPGTCRCACGWEGTPDEFSAHRRAAGHGPASISSTIGSRLAGDADLTYQPTDPFPVTRRQGEPDPDAEPVTPRRTAFARNHPKPKEEPVKVEQVTGAIQRQTDGVCEICGTGFLYRRRGSPKVVCTDACRLEKDRRYQRGLYAARRASAGEPVIDPVIAPEMLAESSDQQVAEAMASVDPMHEWDDLAEVVETEGPATDDAPAVAPQSSDEQVAEAASDLATWQPTDWAQGFDAGYAAATSLGYQAALGAVQDDLARLEAGAQNARVVVDYLMGKIADLGLA